jgi:hypothetical protein
LKEDGCERNRYKGDNFDDEDGIFSIEGGFEVPRVWMVYEILVGAAAPITPNVAPPLNVSYWQVTEVAEFQYSQVYPTLFTEKTNLYKI